MDTLYWKRLSESVQIANTTKQFYSKYLYKMVLNAPGCKSIADNDIASSLSYRTLHSRTVNYGGSWYGARDTRFASEADVVWLERLKALKLSNPDIKVRCEEPKVQIYTPDEATLKQVVAYQCMTLNEGLAASWLDALFMRSQQKPCKLFQTWHSA